MVNDNAETELLRHQRALYTLLTEFDRVCHVLNIPYILFAGTMLGAVRHKSFIPWDDDLDILMLRKDYERFLAEAEAYLDTERFFLQKEFSPHWPMFFSKLRLNGTTCLERYHPRDPETHMGVYMDIFPCDNTLRSELGRRLQFCASKVVIAKSLFARGYETDSRKKKLVMAACRLLPMKPFLRLTRAGAVNSPMVHSFLGGASSYRKSVYPRVCAEERLDASFGERVFPISAHSHSLLTILYGDYKRIPPPEERKCKKHAILLDLNRSYEEYTHYLDDITFDSYSRSIR